jgi:hypothetical protein
MPEYRVEDMEPFAKIIEANERYLPHRITFILLVR